jgi:hypothetical protein
LWLWCARVSWAALPLTAGVALSDALDDWSDVPALVAAVLLWVAWVAGLVALLAPRPWGLTLLRVVAPCAVLVALASVTSTDAADAALAIVSALVAAGFALSPPVAQATGNALAYGDEVRFPLRIPLPLLLAPVPLAVLIIAAGIAAGPLLLADGRIVVGSLALVVGLTAAAFLARSVHSLSRRWLVLVPAGLVVVDPLILVDPVLMVREDVATVAPTSPAPLLDRALDLRLGSSAGSVTIALRAPVSFARRSGRTGGTLVDADVVLIAPTRRAQLLALARGRRMATD